MKIPIILLSFLFLSFNENCSRSSSQHGDVNGTQSSDSAGTHFGVMVAKTEGQMVGPEKQAQIAKALGVKYIRARADIQGWDGGIPAYNAYTDAGLKVLLNINYGVPRNAAGEHDPVPFPTDMAAYSKSVNAILDKYKPEVVVIENEEDNPNYHAGSADDYINELKTGIQIAHSKGLKVTNGGITVREVCFIVWDDMMQHGDKQKAMDFAQKAFPPVFINRLNNLNNPQVARQLEFGRKIIAAYKTLDLDYINFHWYEPVQARGQAGQANSAFDPGVLSFVVNWLKTTTGKPVMTNEFGVFNTSPDLVKDLLKGVRDAGLSYAIFYSADGGEGRAVALQNAGGDLRDNGVAFRDFVKQYGK